MHLNILIKEWLEEFQGFLVAEFLVRHLAQINTLLPSDVYYPTADKRLASEW